MREIITENGSMESIAIIPEAFQTGRWPLLDQNMHTCLKHEPERALTVLEKRWLKAILQDPRIQLFGVSEQGLEDVEPLFDRSFFVYYDQYQDGDPYTDPVYRKNFRMILHACKEKKPLIMNYQARRKHMHVCVMPDHLEYSQKEDQFRLISYNTRGVLYEFNAGQIETVRCGTVWKGNDPLKEQRKKKVTLELVNERRALERAMLSFSDLEKKTVPLDDSRYRLELSYAKNDETEMIIRILSFGPMLRVIGPASFVEKIQERLMKQKDV
jgi:hypothetical protein